MRTKLAGSLGVLAIAIPVAQATAAARTHTKTVAKKTVTRKATGMAADASNWGTVQVIVTAKITTSGGKKKKKIHYTDLGGSYTYHTDRSQYIMSQSLPYLRQEFLTAQTANVQLVSGATDTSMAFEQSLQSALLKLSK